MSFLVDNFIYIIIILILLTLVFLILFFPLLKKKDLKPKEEFEELPNELESVLSKMKQEMVEKDEKEVNNFESEQEENSIISYQELLRAAKKEVKPKFQNTEFISPIYGLVNAVDSYPKIEQISSDKSFTEEVQERLSEDVKKVETTLNTHQVKNEQFLQMLKEFRNSLE